MQTNVHPQNVRTRFRGAATRERPRPAGKAPARVAPSAAAGAPAPLPGPAMSPQAVGPGAPSAPSPSPGGPAAQINPLVLALLMRRGLISPKAADRRGLAPQALAPSLPPAGGNVGQTPPIANGGADQVDNLAPIGA